MKQRAIAAILVLSCLILAVWLAKVFFIRPKPIVDGGIRAQLAVAHVKKDGREIRETNIFVMRDHSYFLQRVHLRFFDIYPECSQFRGVLPDENFNKLRSLLDSATFKTLHASRAKVPSNWSSESWYIAASSAQQKQFFAFSDVDESDSAPPRPFLEWFSETEKLSPGEVLSKGRNECSVFSNDTAAMWR